MPDESVDWETTQNLMIEGDNLEVLKLLRKSYAGTVKLIYVDPPYNTGRDFIYPDNFRDSIGNYLEITGQVGDGGRITSNTETSGRFHSGWLNMMYPRLILAREMLAENGVIFISIDDSELENLRVVCREIFGEENFVAQIIWRDRSTPPNDKIIGANHDYILAYARNIDHVALNLRPRSEERVAKYQNPDNHPKGPWVVGDLSANVKGGRYSAALSFPIRNPNTGEDHYPGEGGNWRFGRETVERLIEGNEIYFGPDGRGRPRLKRFLADVKPGTSWPTIWDFTPLNGIGSREITDLFDGRIAFENPKPTGLICEILRLGTGPDDLVMDFFAGSGTTGHAVLELNRQDGGNRRCIQVQLPEPTGRDDFPTLADVCAERLRRVARGIHDESPMFVGDLGFRVFKLDSSNIREWDPQPEKLDSALELSVENLKADRSEDDILYELLLKRGIELTVPIETRDICGKTVHSVGAGTLFACLAERVERAEAEPLALGIVAWRSELDPAGDVRVVFRDSAFVDDVAKTNLAEILKQHGLPDVKSI
ncbi:MAG: hypothetical protein IT189_10905 [Microbacteriaceae bacterium]|nr:hypothetical protein [Microbacteriaceae bacterium]